MKTEQANLHIEDFEDKKTSNGKPYVRVKTNEGWMSCFTSAGTEVKRAVGTTIPCLVKITEKEDGSEFRNITKVLSDEEQAEEDLNKSFENHNKAPKETKESSEKPKTDYDSFAVSYAKDLCAIMLQINAQDPKKIEQPENVMTEAINCIKKAQKAFKK